MSPPSVINDSALAVGGNLSVTSDWAGSVIAVIESAALALKVNTGSSQGDGATSVTVAPVIALNKISSRTEARIIGLSDADDNTVGGDLTVHAIGTTQILPLEPAISVAAGASGAQKAIGIGAVIGRNVINADSTVEVEGANAVLDVGGAALVQALDDSLIHAELYATAVSIGAGTQDVKAIAMAAAIARNDITSTVTASVHDLAAFQSLGSMRVEAKRLARIESIGRATAVSVALSLGSGSTPAVSGAGTVSLNYITGGLVAEIRNVASIVSGGALTVLGINDSHITSNPEHCHRGVRLDGRFHGCRHRHRRGRKHYRLHQCGDPERAGQPYLGLCACHPAAQSDRAHRGRPPAGGTGLSLPWREPQRSDLFRHRGLRGRRPVAAHRSGGGTATRDRPDHECRRDQRRR
jgi:hypothetical protein